MHRVFIGCSTEALPVARALQANLAGEAEVSVWDQGLFEPSAYALETLIHAVANSEFGIFVLAPDDLLIVRNDHQHAIRDNVLIELGLFLGALGRDAVMAVMPGNVPVHIPSDLHGLMLVRYRTDRADGNLRAALGPACTAMTTKLGRTPRTTYPTPVELSLPILAVSDSMGRRQRELLQLVTICERVDVPFLRTHMPAFTAPELHYRLECLRLLSFIQKCKPDETLGDNPRELIFELHPRYKDALSAAGLDGHPLDTSFGELDAGLPNAPTIYSGRIASDDGDAGEGRAEPDSQSEPPKIPVEPKRRRRGSKRTGDAPR